MAMLKYGHAVVASPVVDPGKWVDKVVPAGRVKVAKNVIATYDPSKWLLSHTTIMASVDVDQADPNDKKSNYFIKPEYSVFVNNNGDSWERLLLRACYHTFLGANNFLEHVQLPELSKGKVIDVAIREVPFTKSQDGKDLTTLYVDILIATNRGHIDLVDKIQSGEYSAVSMGCLIKYSQCSQCGNIAEDESKACKHVRFFKKNFFYDKNGVRRIIAELCGRVEDPDSCRFIDASWVRKPAFEGAVLRNLVEPNSIDVGDKFTKAFAVPGFVKMDGMYLKAAAVKAAEEIVNEIQAQDEPASEAPAADAPAEPPADDSRFPEAPADTEAPLDKDSPPPEGGEAPPPDAGGAMGVPPAGGAPDAPPQPQIEEPFQDATVTEVKDMLKKLVLNDIRRDLMKGVAQTATPPEERPNESAMSSNTSLVKDAAITRMFRAASNEVGERLANGLLILSGLKDWGKMRRYGYNRDDMLGILYYVDMKTNADPVGQDAVRALRRVKLGTDGDARGFFTEMIVEIGRRPSPQESRKLLKWAGILRSVEG